MSDDLKISSAPLALPAKKVNAGFQPQSKPELEKAAKEFEGMFMDIVMKSMRQSVPTEEGYGNSEKVQFFQTMLDEQYSKISTEKHGIGLAQAIIRQLTPRIEAEELARVQNMQAQPKDEK